MGAVSEKLNLRHRKIIWRVYKKCLTNLKLLSIKSLKRLKIHIFFNNRDTLGKNDME